MRMNFENMKLPKWNILKIATFMIATMVAYEVGAQDGEYYQQGGLEGNAVEMGFDVRDAMEYYQATQMDRETKLMTSETVSLSGVEGVHKATSPDGQYTIYQKNGTYYLVSQLSDNTLAAENNFFIQDQDNNGSFETVQRITAEGQGVVSEKTVEELVAAAVLGEQKGLHFKVVDLEAGKFAIMRDGETLREVEDPELAGALIVAAAAINAGVLGQ